METKVTSKTSSLQALLLRAWRERWSDLQWGIQIKTILPRGVSGDVHNLADCILQQALVGPGPNQLVLSYLKHSLSSQLVSYAAVLQRISKYDGVHKPHCIISLLEFVEAILGRMTCRSRAEEGTLATAVLSLVNWLLTIALHALHKLSELCTSPEHATMLLRPTALVSTLISCDFAKAMLCLARLDDKDLHSEVVRKCLELETAFSQPLNFKIGINADDTLKTLVRLRSLGLPSLTGPGLEDGASCEPVTYCLQPLLAVEVLLNPSSDTQMFVNQVLMVQRIKGYNMARLYAEVMRACLISLKDVLGSNEQSQWGAFTFLKVPHILLQLHRHVRGGSQGSVEQPDFSQDVVDAVELLLQHTPLLDTVDVKCSCNCVECLLAELARVGLVSEHHVKLYSAKREGAVAAVQKPDPAAQTGAIPKVIIRAEPTLARILKTLDADYLKIQDALLSVLSQVLTGKSFELILAVATVQGKLRTFVAKLINFNECSRLPAPDEASGGKGSLTRAMLFDVSFLMLCSIVQTYGSDVVLSEEGGAGGDSFFEQWVRECMAERNHPKSPDLMLRACEPAKLDALLAQFSASDVDFKTSQVRWHEVCRHVPAATRELLFAWEQGALSPTDVKRTLDSMRSRMGCLPVCAAAWLCSYMQILDQDALLKPMNMVQQFLTPTDDMPQQDNYKERSSLTFQIIRKMQYDLHPPSMNKANKLSHNIVSGDPISEQLASVWTGTHQRGWINIEATHTLESLLHTGGAQWFVTNIIKEVLTYRYREDLDKAVDLAFALFHLDIEQCSLTLLHHLLPLYLHNQLQGEELVEPQASALAKLSAYCVFAALESPNTTSPGPSGCRKRTRREIDPEDLDGILPSAKVLRLSSTDSQGESTSLMFGGGSSTSGTSAAATSEASSSVPVLREPLKKALTSLFQAFSVIAQDGEVSQQTHFVFKFLEFCVSCGKERARLVLQVMPGSLVPSLLSSLPDLFSTDLLLRLYDTSTGLGRKDTARDLCMLRNMSLQPPASPNIRELTSQA